jgi:hypothetical protein
MPPAAEVLALIVRLPPSNRMGRVITSPPVCGVWSETKPSTRRVYPRIAV